MTPFRPSAPAISNILRLASQPPSTQLCRRCLLRQQRTQQSLRTFSSTRPSFQSSKRPLMTDTASTRPQTLDPRNEGVPETSITPGTASHQQTWPPSPPWERKDSALGIAAAEREAEAQKSKPTAASTTNSTEKAFTKSKSKLRPRKAPITLTASAVEQLRTLHDAPESKLIRVGVKNRGCSGLAYHLEYVDKAGSFDEVVMQDGVEVLIDSKALFSIIGSEMDWVSERLGERFVFRNPNISEQCGCGESFSVG